MKKRGRKHLRGAVDKDSSCYVLITCGKPSKDGEMQVQMTYQGDAALAAYLLQGAQSFFDHDEDECSHFSEAFRLVKC